MSSTTLPTPAVVEPLDYEAILAAHRADLVARHPAAAAVLGPRAHGRGCGPRRGVYGRGLGRRNRWAEIGGRRRNKGNPGQ